MHLPPRVRIAASVFVATGSLLGATTASANTIVEDTARFLHSKHSATFAGRYYPSYNTTNRSSTCQDFSAGANTCAVWFNTPSNFKKACTSRERVGYGYFAPVAADPSKQFSVDLYWQGGGALEGTGFDLSSGLAYVMHIQVADLCGDSAATVDSSLNGLDAGSWNLSGTASPSYKFTGYVDLV
jgi:hypothetical protein